MKELNDSDNGFSDWFYELEGFAFRRERFQNDVELCTFQQDCEYTWSQMRKWVEAAYQAGYERGRKK